MALVLLDSIENPDALEIASRSVKRAGIPNFMVSCFLVTSIQGDDESIESTKQVDNSSSVSA